MAAAELNHGMDIRTRLTRTVYMFGSTTNGPYGLMTFAPNGRVTTRRKMAEYRWRMNSEGLLTFASPLGQATSVLAPGPNGSFIPDKGYPHYLHPLFALGPPPAKSALPALFVNTLPKAGTYLIARALENIGYTNLGLHVMDEHFHDNRGVSEDEIHWDPEARQVALPAHAIAALIRPGEFAVGHLNDFVRMRGVDRAGPKMLSVVREPRAQLVSMFVFLNRKVKPSAEVRLWQSMAGLDAFKGFLAASPVHRWLDQLTVITENFSFLRYEDLRAGKVSPRAAGVTLARKLPAGLSDALGTRTSTYIQRDHGETEGFTEDPVVLAYLEEIGAMELSRKYWPELNQN